MRFASSFTKALVVAGVYVAACSPADTEPIATRSDAILSNVAEILDFNFEGEVLADDSITTRRSIVRQVLYAQGILRTANDASGKVGNVDIPTVTETKVTEDKKRVRYKATLPVAWPPKLRKPSTYDLQLPRDATTLVRFNQKYDGRCGQDEHGQEYFWHDWNPHAPKCVVDPSDVIRVQATVSPHVQTNGKYPEYDKIWEDGRLDVVAMFGVIESNDANDYGYTEAQHFVDWVSKELADVHVEQHRMSRSILADTTITGKATVGGQARDVKVDVFVIGHIALAGPDFDARYDPLTEKADLVLYNGHAQLGANTNALGRKGKVLPGKYQVFLLNGCESFALIDDTMTERRREANGPSDPEGTKFLDVITNAKPGYANNLANISYLVVKAALLADTPISYSRLISRMPESHVVVVWGEEDNAFHPPDSFRHLPIVFQQQPFALSF